MCDIGLHFCYCVLCLNKNKIKAQDMFLQSISENLTVQGPYHLLKGSILYGKVIDNLLQHTPLVYNLPRKSIVARFTSLVDAHPLITHKEALEGVFVSELDPIIRLRFDQEYRKRFLSIYNVI